MVLYAGKENNHTRIYFNRCIAYCVSSVIQDSDWIVDKMFESLASMAFYTEKYMTSSKTIINFSEIYVVVFSFGVALIVLKFLKKGFDIYIGWDAGDPDSDPLGLLVNFFRALIIAIGFPVLYSLLLMSRKI